MYVLAARLNQEQRYPQVHFFYEQGADGRYIHYDNYEYFNDDELKDYVLDMVLELYTKDELQDFYITYQQRVPNVEQYIGQLIGFAAAQNIAKMLPIVRPRITLMERQT